MRFNEEPEKALVVASATKTVTVPGNLKYKGVVQQQNGHWGAQICADNKRIWLGTFKSAAEAATAYDSASIKLPSFDANSHRNFPWSDLTVHEREFQDTYELEAVLNMIRDGSYQHKFRDFLKLRPQMVARINVGGSKQVRGEADQESDKCFSCTQLFQKVLTPSDVGKVNRLVIPKKYAVKYMPCINEKLEEGEQGRIGGAVEDVEIVFDDRTMRQWKFKYSFWKSSQSIVFTRGLNAFVKEKNLKEKDIIVFYDCDVPSDAKTLEGQSKNFKMIDVHYFSGNGFMVPEEVSKTAQESSGEEMKTGNLFSSKLEDEEPKSEENNYAVWNFKRFFSWFLRK
ncbi:PREDICTED: AP2/ERF and B3 domain-containing transcription factor At1g50680-like [Camelina sativa]|uniref:AP2/ERF and B3 domain-containing transcription factor At1g50680-like n=1 Tax=Camelina sativa TaxID=90675 RepID=A0ABM0V6R0_CAMSA|nr:PREDICTED: AP2/ERF and B3 domain-containing transcription factor At1g50680-like [Camelina sativa]